MPKKKKPRDYRRAFSFKEARKIGDRLGVDWTEVDIKQFKMGLREELEHTDVTKGDPILTGKIVLAHLEELPDFYTRLKKMEKG